MTDIKSINHQNILSTQSAPEEATQKNSEIVKESKPAEFRPLSNEQKESIKLTRNAENKMAESAIVSGVTRGLEEYNKRGEFLSTAAGSDSVKNEPSKEFVKAGGQQDDIPKEFLPIQTGPTAEYQSSEPALKAEKFFPSIRFEPATPILDGEDEREEEGLGLSVVATEPPSIKSGNE
jgi:hypothetical protein